MSLAARTSAQPQQQSGPALFAGRSLLQRKCACGARSAGGACAECKGAGLQRKLTVGAVNDPLEAEADRTADQVMAASTGTSAHGSPPRIQRRAGATETSTEVAAPASVDRALSQSGTPLETGLRHDMEHRFGHDFSRVRIHSDAGAAQSARDVDAHAYTVGESVVFAPGRYAPATHEGRRLIAHELTHVVQQGGASGAALQRDVAIEPQGNRPERTLSEQDIKAAVSFNADRIKNKKTLGEIRDVVGIAKEPAVSDRDLALAVARWQANHGAAQDGKLGPVTVMLLVEELQAEGSLVSGLNKEADALKAQFSKGTLLDVDTSFCGCKPRLEAEVRSADSFIGEYTACGADPANKTGPDIENCIKARAAATGSTITTLGTTSSTGAIAITGARSGPCAKLMERVDLAHEQIHSVHTGELKQQHGAGTAAFNAAFIDATDWVADEINSRNTDKAVAKWALSVLQRICP